MKRYLGLIIVLAAILGLAILLVVIMSQYAICWACG